MIYQINHIWTAEINWKGNDRRSERNLYNCVRSLRKNPGLQRGLHPCTRDTGTMLYQLSYEATDVGRRSIVGSYVPLKEMSVNDIWNKSYMNPQLTCSQRQWLHSSVGRASHRYREVTVSNPVEVLNFFHASFRLRSCINSVHCDEHFFFKKIFVHTYLTSLMKGIR